MRPSASKCIPVHQTPSDSIRLYQTFIHLQKLEIDGKRSKSIFGGIEGSSGEVSARRSGIFGSRPKFLFSKNGMFKKVPGAISDGRRGDPQKMMTVGLFAPQLPVIFATSSRKHQHRRCQRHRSRRILCALLWEPTVSRKMPINRNYGLWARQMKGKLRTDAVQ